MVNKGDAFLVIDMNQDLLYPAGRLFAGGIPGEPGPEELVERIVLLNSLPFGYRIMVSENHQPGHFEFDHYPVHAIENSAGQKWPDQLSGLYDRANFRLVKGTEEGLMSGPLYASADFFLMIRSLRYAGINRIFLAGLAYDQCLGEAAIVLSHQRFEAVIIRDAARSVPPPRGKAEIMEQILRLYGIKEVKFSDFRL